MATTVRKIDGLLAQHANGALNPIRMDLVRIKLGLIFHADATAADVSPTAVDLPTVLVMANNLKAELNAHFASALDFTMADAAYAEGVHAAADATNVISAAAAVDQGTANTLLNAIKTALNAHFTQAGVHIANDGTNTVVAAAASSLSTSVTLANACQAAANAHFAAAMAHQATSTVPA